MRTVYEILGEVVGGSPPEWVERATPWIIGVMGAGMAGMMVYGWW